MRKPSAKETAFIQCYLKREDMNATQAAIEAGYAASSAKQTASHLLKRPRVAARIQRAMEERAREAKIDAAWLLRRLAAESEADMADIFNDDGTVKAVKDMPEIWRKGLVMGFEVEEINVEGVTIGTVKKVKLSDRLRRLELIGKHVDVSAFEERLRVDSNQVTRIEVEFVDSPKVQDS